MWDMRSFIIGLLIGMIIMLLIIWLLYITRSFVFYTCPRVTTPCEFSNYVKDPSIPLTAGANINDILFISEQPTAPPTLFPIVTPNNQPVPITLPTMTYKQVKKDLCNPLSTNQAVVIDYPQYCNFTSTDDKVYLAKNLRFGSSTYTFLDEEQKINYVVANQGGQCQPISSTNNLIKKGEPVLKWDI